MRRTPCRSGVVPAALLLLALTLLTLAARTATAVTDPIYLLRLVYDTTDVSGDEDTAIWDGVSAALYAGSSGGSYKTVNGQTITVVTRSVGADPTNSVTVVQNALADYPTLLAILGPGNSAGLNNLLSSTVLTDNSLVCFSPFTYSSELRYWTPYLYYTRADPQSELLLLLNYTLNTLRVIRVGFMYLSGSMIGDVEYARAVSLLAAAGQNAPVLYTAAFDNTAPLNTTAFDAMADKGVQAIIIFAPPTPQTRDFVRQALTDPRTSAAVLLGPSMLMSLLQEQYTLLSNAGTIAYQDNHVLSSLTNEMPNKDMYGYVKVFQTQMTDYIANSGTSSYTDSSYYLTNLTMGAAMLSGWVGGQVLMLTLENLAWTNDAASFVAGLFRQNRYVVIPDYIVGDYGGTCDSYAESQGAMCYCNQGGSVTYLASLVNQEFWSTEINYINSFDDCYTTGLTFSTPLNIIIMNFSDVPGLLQAANALAALSNVLSLTSSTSYGSMSFNIAMVSTVSAATTAQSALDNYLTTHGASVIRGPLLSSMNTSLMVVSPYYEVPSSPTVRKNYLTLRPTTSQFFYIIMGNYATLGVTTSTLVLRGYSAATAAALVASATKTADNFVVDVPTVKRISATDDLWASMKRNGVTMVMGIRGDDAATMAAFLTRYTNARIFVAPRDFYVFYTAISQAFATLASSVQERLLFMTNLPLWTDTSAEANAASEALNAYHAVTPAPYHPFAFEAMITSWFLESVVSNVASNNASVMLDFIYKIGMIAAKDIILGEFKWDCPDPSLSTCIRQNFGARAISTMSMRRVFDPTVPLTLEAQTPVMTYRARPFTGLTKGQLAGAIASSVVGGLLIIGAVLLILYCVFRDQRDNGNAPKTPEDPVTLVFTDIESSTALWAALPQQMPEAVAAHHSIIRAAIKKYKCYEVKTIGDSFMIACKDAHAAVKLANEVQVKFLEHDWKTDDIDEAYRMFEMERAQDDEEKKPHTAQLSLEAYDTMWRGLRVRMGIHTGLSDIRLDEVTGGYDYYGDTSNMAARTEAVANGGQVIMTEATWWGLSEAVRGEVEHTKMGPQGLRGVPYAVEMYQLDPVEGREHCKLRTEIDAVLPDDDTTYSGDTGTQGTLSSHTNMSTTATAVAFVLSSCFSTYPPPQRIREVQPLLAKWNVASPPKPKGISDEDYCKGLFDRLAVRVGRVTEARIRLNGSDGRTMSNLLPSFAGTGMPSHNPLGDQGSYVHPSFAVVGASRRSQDKTGVAALQEALRSALSPQSSRASRSRRATVTNSCNTGSPDNVVLFSTRSSRRVSTSGGQAVPEPPPRSVNNSGTLTRRFHHAGGKSDTDNSDLPEME